MSDICQYCFKPFEAAKRIDEWKSMSGHIYIVESCKNCEMGVIFCDGIQQITGRKRPGRQPRKKLPAVA